MRTISDHPLLVGEILERADARKKRRKHRANRLQWWRDVLVIAWNTWIKVMWVVALGLGLYVALAFMKDALGTILK